MIIRLAFNAMSFIAKSLSSLVLFCFAYSKTYICDYGHMAYTTLIYHLLCCSYHYIHLANLWSTHYYKESNTSEKHSSIFFRPMQWCNYAFALLSSRLNKTPVMSTNSWNETGNAIFTIARQWYKCNHPLLTCVFGHLSKALRQIFAIYILPICTFSQNSVTIYGVWWNLFTSRY